MCPILVISSRDCSVPSVQSLYVRTQDSERFAGDDGCVDAASRKHAYIILTPLNPIFYIVKLGLTGIYIIFLISA